MGKSKALDPAEKLEIQALAKSVLDAHFSGRGGQVSFGRATGISQAQVSDMVNNGVAGIRTLKALARFRPVDVVRLLGIKLETIVGLWRESDAPGVDMAQLPENLRRAARAAVELYGCTPDEAHAAALDLLKQPLENPTSREAESWLLDIRGKLPPRSKSGLRRRKV